MVVKLGTNIASLTAQRRLAEGTSQLAKTYERLSSGMRINRASDDAAGLAISDSLRADARIFAQGVRNLNDGISLLNIADAAVENLTSIVVRIQELAEQSANGVYGITQRAALDREAQSLSAEFIRIAQSTEFNGRKLLNGSTSQVNLQAGVGLDAVLQSGVGGKIGTGQLTLNIAATIGFSNMQFPSEAKDFNNDGNIDFFAGHRIIFGNGNGSFSPAISLDTSYAGSAGTAHDIDNDGDLDLIFHGTASGQVRAQTYLNDGKGNFSTSVTSMVYSNLLILTPSFLQADMNADGVVDLVSKATTWNGVGTENIVHVAYGNTNGSFGSGQQTILGAVSASDSMRLANFDGDNNPDILFYSTGAGTPFTMEFQGGTFTPISTVGGPASFRDVEIVDFNGDGKDEFITAQNGLLSSFLNNGNGTFQMVSSVVDQPPGATPFIFDILAEDLDGDGTKELISNGSTHLVDPQYVTAYDIGKNGSFTQISRNLGANVLINWTHLTAADINNDGVKEFFSHGSSPGYFIYNQTVQGTGAILPFSLRSIADARQAIPVLQQKLSQLAEQRGIIGAHQARIAVATNVLEVGRENFLAAESRIRDADIAQESADLTRLTILQQAAAAILAQANQQPALALKLLGGV